MKDDISIAHCSSKSDKVESSHSVPYFNSPSKPPFRLLDDEDDLGNFIENPELRHPVDYSGPPMTSEERQEYMKQNQILANEELNVQG